MKNFITGSMSFLLMMMPGTGYTQMEEPSSVTSIFKLNFLMPGFSYEQKMATYQAIYLATYMDLRAVQIDNDDVNFLFAPTFNAEFRNYYNINWRNRKRLRTDMNSANYLAPLYIGRYSEESENADAEWVSQIGAVWGMQRNAPRGFSLDLSLGLVYTFSYSLFEPIAQLTLGFWMGDKSR